METDVLTLAEFLLARIAEDEARARDVYEHLLGGDEWCLRDKVLAECEAKRRIVETATRYLRDDWDNPSGASVSDAVLCALGIIYAEHPDYRDVWRVSAD